MRALLLAALLFAPASQATIITLEFSGDYYRGTTEHDPLGVTGAGVEGHVPMSAIMTIDTSKLDSVEFPYLPGWSSAYGEGTNAITSLYVTIGDLMFGLDQSNQRHTIFGYENVGQIEGAITGIKLAPGYGYDSLPFALGDTRFCISGNPEQCDVADLSVFDPGDPIATLLSGSMRELQGGLGPLGAFGGTWVQVPEPGTLALFSFGLLGLALTKRRSARALQNN